MYYLYYLYQKTVIRSIKIESYNALSRVSKYYKSISVNTFPGNTSLYYFMVLIDSFMVRKLLF